MKTRICDLCSKPVLSYYIIKKKYSFGDTQKWDICINCWEKIQKEINKQDFHTCPSRLSDDDKVFLNDLFEQYKIQEPSFNAGIVPISADEFARTVLRDYKNWWDDKLSEATGVPKCYKGEKATPECDNCIECFIKEKYPEKVD